MFVDLKLKVIVVKNCCCVRGIYFDCSFRGIDFVSLHGFVDSLGVVGTNLVAK